MVNEATTKKDSRYHTKHVLLGVMIHRFFWFIPYFTYKNTILLTPNCRFVYIHWLSRHHLSRVRAYVLLLTFPDPDTSFLFHCCPHFFFSWNLTVDVDDAFYLFIWRYFQSSIPIPVWVVLKHTKMTDQAMNYHHQTTSYTIN